MKRHHTIPLYEGTPLARAGAALCRHGAAGWRRVLLALLAVGLLAGAPAQAQGPLPMAVTAAAADGKVATKAKAQDQERSVLRQKPVAIHLQYLDPQAGTPAPQVGVELFDGAVVTLDLEGVDQRGGGNFTWHGKVQGYKKSRVTLSVVAGQIAGTIVLVDDASQPGGVYQIQSGADGVPSLRQIDTNAFPPDHPPGSETARPPQSAGKSLSSAADSKGGSLDTKAADSGATIDVMVLYSNQTAAAAGAGIAAQVQQAVDTANAVYANSGITPRLRLVYSGAPNYNESGDYGTDLNWLSGNAGVAALRNTYGADMVSLFVENGSYCGMAWIGPNVNNAFSVINRGCASGNYSFPHELGHNFGALHDPYVDPSTSPYAYGHGITDPSEGWRDVMAYNNACGAVGASCTRIAYFANPNLSYGNPPHPLGTTSTSDVVRVHNQNAVAVANYRAAVSGGCTYALSPSGASVAATAGSGSFSVTAGTGCAWSTVANAAWLSVGAGSGSTGNGTLNYAWTANTGPARSGTFTVGGQTYTVNQAAGCSYSLTPTSASVAAGGGSGTTNLVTTSGCAWTASSSATWLTRTSAASGSGNATISYSVAANTGATRSANMTIGGVTFVVTQATAVVPPGATTTTLVSSGSPATAGTTVTFTATVTGSSPSGSLGFTDNGATLTGCSSVALAGSGNARTATCSTGALPAGNHNVVANYAGDAGNSASSSAPLVEVINAASTGTGGNNVALASAGAVASASSAYSTGYPVSAINNGDRTGAGWGSGGGWNDATSNSYPDWVQIVFNGSKTISSVVVYTLQDAYANPVEPTDSMTFTNYGITDFTVAGWNGTAWVTLGTVTGNNLVKRTVTFSPFTTDRIRVTVNNALAGFSRITEIEALTAGSSVATTTTLVSSGSPATAGTTVTFTATVTGSSPSGSLGFTDNGATLTGCSSVALAGSGNARTATCSTGALPAGNHNVVANYAGDAGNSASSSAPLVEVINAASTGTGGNNVALASAGAVASASSAYSTGYPVSAINNGDRTGAGWGSGGGWNDATSNSYPDWVQIVFNGSKTISSVVVYTLQDAYANPVEPTDSMTFTNYGITDFTVAGWNGTAWVTLGTVTGNNLVKRTVTFSPFTTDRIRVTVNNALAGFSRITEIEAFASSTSPIDSVSNGTNVALASMGAVASASSAYGAGYPVSAINNGDRTGAGWGSGGGWNDATSNSYPDWVQIVFNGSKTISSVVVYTLQDAYANPVEPTDSMTFTNYGITDFTVAGWNGTAWVTLGTVTGNNLVKRTVSFSLFTTDRIRVTVNSALGGFSRITEIEAFVN